MAGAPILQDIMHLPGPFRNEGLHGLHSVFLRFRLRVGCHLGMPFRCHGGEPFSFFCSCLKLREAAGIAVAFCLGPPVTVLAPFFKQDQDTKGTGDSAIGGIRVSGVNKSRP